MTLVLRRTVFLFTAGELARIYREKGPFIDEKELARIEHLERDDQPSENNWADR